MGSRLRFWSSECPCAPGPNCFPSCAMRCHRSLSCEVPFRHTQPHRIISVNQMALSVRFRLDLRRCRRRSALRSFPEGAAFRSSQSRLLSSLTAGPPLSEIPALPWEVDVPAGLWVPLPWSWLPRRWHLGPEKLPGRLSLPRHGGTVVHPCRWVGG